jgi:hypothetical protein
VNSAEVQFAITARSLDLGDTGLCETFDVPRVSHTQATAACSIAPERS